jgi:hypothetical protein
VSPNGDHPQSRLPDGKQVVYQRMIFALKQGQPIYSRDREFSLHFSGEFPAISTTGKVALTPFSLKSSGGSSGLNVFNVSLYTSDLNGTNLQQVFRRTERFALPGPRMDNLSLLALALSGRAKPAGAVPLMKADGRRSARHQRSINSVPHFS